MKHLKELVTNYMNSWIECSKCYNMCKSEHISSNNDDTLICDDCVEEDIMSHWIN